MFSCDALLGIILRQNIYIKQMHIVIDVRV